MSPLWVSPGGVCSGVAVRASFPLFPKVAREHFRGSGVVAGFLVASLGPAGFKCVSTRRYAS